MWLDSATAAQQVNAACTHGLLVNSLTWHIILATASETLSHSLVHKRLWHSDVDFAGQVPGMYQAASSVRRLECCGQGCSTLNLILAADTSLSAMSFQDDCEHAQYHSQSTRLLSANVSV